MSTCPWTHNNVDTLYGVTPMPIRELPKTCTCGEPITYADEVVFVSAPITFVPDEGIMEVAPWSVVKDRPPTEDNFPIGILFSSEIPKNIPKMKTIRNSDNYCTCECHDGRNVMHFMDCCGRCPYCKQERIADVRDHFNCCTQYLFHHNQGEPT